MTYFKDRTEAGLKLGESLKETIEGDDTVVLGLPRGGVPVAYEVASILNAPLDVFMVRKLGVPGQEELAMGSIAQGGLTLLNEDIVRTMDIPSRVIDKVAEVEKVELERRLRKYRGSRETPDVSGKTVLLVDDGLATGASMLAAIKAVRKLDPRKVIAAVPVAAEPTCRRLESEADKVVCMHTPGQFSSVGQWYENFPQVSDEEVCELMREKRPV
ncbi:MAG TPA: phosphoribosyltransferase [candidate division Zixibacteria bacterium]|nr:phosphoribosyltransferase [candidate division Zixibacteria bacterium]